MTEASPTNSLVRNSLLVVAGTYERLIGASLERVWENVYDWEHLPYLHAEAFTSISLIDSGDWGWRVNVGMAGGSEATIELITNRAAHHYVARTLEGSGAPSEIWTTLDPVALDETGIQVEFCVQPMPEEALTRLGKGFVGLYTLLWNQDEEMMQMRTAALAERDARQRDGGPRRSPSDAMETISLGTVEELRSRLPLIIKLGGHEFRVVEVDDELIAHATECPHLLGPLGDCTTNEGTIVCPWHGYAFDIRSGRSSDGRSFRLRPAPQIEIDAAHGTVVASFPERSREASGSEGDHGSS